MTRKQNPYLTIDTDSHCGVPVDIFDRFLDPEIRKRPDAPRFVDDGHGLVFRCGSYQFPRRAPPRPGAEPPKSSPSAAIPGPRGSWDADYRVKTFQDLEGVDRCVMMPYGIMFPSFVGDRELGNALTRAWNDWLHDFCQQHPQRMFGYGMLNIADPAGAVQELRRCVLELGFPSVNINTSAVGKRPEDYYVLSDEALYPIWDEAQRLGVPISIHSFPDPHVEGHEYNWPRRPVPLYDSIGFPTASMGLFAHLVLGGVCETFPKLKFGLFECTIGWVPQALHGIRNQREVFEDVFDYWVPKMKLDPVEYIQRQIYFSVESEDPFIRTFIDWTKAPERLMYSSDYPHLEYHPGTVDELLSRDDLSQREKQLIVGENALGYYRWEDTATPTVIERPTTAVA
jgi:predicted TIM-barrel fold metal-dependent hydrolase